MITVELLDDLLSPGSPAHDGYSSRERAEAHLKSLSVTDRSKALMNIFAVVSNESQFLLASVLLRRDIAKLGGEVLVNRLPSEQCVSILNDMVRPLLTIIQRQDIATKCRQQVGYCLAELCSSLSLLSAHDSDAATRLIIESIGPSVSI